MTVPFIDVSPKVYDFSKPWLRTDEGAAYVGYRGKHALRSFYRFLEKKGVPTVRRFRAVLVARADLDRALGVGGPRQVVGRKRA